MVFIPPIIITAVILWALWCIRDPGAVEKKVGFLMLFKPKEPEETKRHVVLGGYILLIVAAIQATAYIITLVITGGKY